MPTKKKPGGGGGGNDGPRKGAHLMDQFGIGMNMKEFESMLYDDDDIDDDDVMAELAALNGDDPPPKVTRNARRGLVTFDDINKMASESLRDIPSDEELSDSEDADLLLELSQLNREVSPPPPVPRRSPVSPQQPLPPQLSPAKSPKPSPVKSPTDTVSVLKERMAMYKAAIDTAGDRSKQRRLNRGIKTLEDLLRSAQAGRSIEEDSIPPPVSAKPRAPPSDPSPATVPDKLPTEETMPDSSPPQLSPPQASPPEIPARNVFSPSVPPMMPPPRANRVPSSSQSPGPVPAPRTHYNPNSPSHRPPPGAVQVLPSPPKPLPETPPKAPSRMSPTTAAPAPSQNNLPTPVRRQNNVPVQESSNSVPAPARPQVPSKAPTTQETLNIRRDQYKSAAVTAKHAGDMATATKYARVAKQFDAVIKALEDDKPIDLSKMPPPPPGFPVVSKESITSASPITEIPLERSSHSAQEPEPSSNAEEMVLSAPPLSPSAQKKLYKAPQAPTTVLEALEQRMAKYKSSEDEAKQSGSSSKARRMGRIVKQYQDAIKAYQAGKPVNFEDLPAPPGFGPVPTSDASPAQAASHPSPAANAATASPTPPPQVAPAPKPPMRHQQPQVSGEGVSEGEIRRRASARKSVSSRQEQHVAFLKERMVEYRNAAIQAKKDKNMELAKAYLRQAKGFEPMLEAAEGGLPVDLSKVPPPLNNDEDDEEKYVIVDPEDCKLSGDREEVFKKLQENLVSQIQMCSTSSKHFTKLGDVLSASRFQKLEQSCIKDLDALKSTYRHGDPLPKFHYETKTFSMVQCNADLGDNDLELTIVHGIKYNLPSSYSAKDLDTYVKFEFPFPSDDPQIHTTETVKDTDSPEYNESIKLQINRRSRALLRVFEKKSLKLEIYYRRGFLKSDKVLGTVNIKLQSLETKCTVHDSYDLMEGRKSVGGKLEVKLRMRDPLKNKQVEEVKEEWLIIDKFLRKRTVGDNITPSEKQTKLAGSGSTSMEVLRYEKQQLDKQISHLKDTLNPSQLQTLNQKSKFLQDKIEKQHSMLKAGGKDALKAYVAHLEMDAKSYTVEAQVMAKQGDMQKAQVLLTKRKLAEKEIAAIRNRIPDI